MSSIDFNNPKKMQQELEKLLKERFGDSINILSHAQIKQDTASREESHLPPNREDKRSLDDILSFHKTPKELKSYLDRYIIGQEDAKRTLAIAICNHYNQLKYFHSLTDEAKKDYEYSKQNVLLIGPTGVGKTYMVRQIAKLINVPFVRADATKYSETGYMGGNVEDLVKDLVQQAGNQIERASYGIIYIDEADKLATSYSGSYQQKDISGRGVQLGLLKMLEDTEIDLRSGHDPASQMQALLDLQSSGGKVKPKVVSTRHILFILSGAFTDLEDIVSKRISAKSIGFFHDKNNSPHKPSNLKNLRTEDLIEYGYEPEFVGRLPVRVACHYLSVDDLYQILKTSHGSIIHQYQRSFNAYGIKTTFSDEALMEVARRAHHENTGARSLVTILDQTLKNFIFELPSSPIRTLEVNADLICHPDKALEQTLQNIHHHTLPALTEAIQSFEQTFFKTHDIPISLTEKASLYILREAEGDATKVPTLLHERLLPFEYAIKILAQNSDNSMISLSQECLEDPYNAFQNLIKASFTHSSSNHDTTKDLHSSEKSKQTSEI